MRDESHFVVSADSHVTEPADLWVERLDRKYRNVAPRVVRDFKQDIHLFVAPGIIPFAIATGFGAGKNGAELKNHQNRGYEAARPGGWDPAERIKDQNADGVHAEILYPTHGVRLFSLPDSDLQQACFRVYNDWMSGFAAFDAARLHALALISLHDVGHGIRELEYAKKLGFKGAMIWGSTPPEKPSFATRSCDPFWEACQELELPAPQMYELFGEDNYMWASDYPHVDSTWPTSASAIERALGSLPHSVREKMVGENACRVYGIERECVSCDQSELLVKQS